MENAGRNCGKTTEISILSGYSKDVWKFPVLKNDHFPQNFIEDLKFLQKT